MHKESREKTINENRFVTAVELQLDAALVKAKSIGGKYYRGKDFGGGIVFQSYDTTELKNDILKLRS